MPHSLVVGPLEPNERATNPIGLTKASLKEFDESIINLANSMD
jgi:hypothetical protein